MAAPLKHKEIAELLADFIVTNWHHCPINEDIEVLECDGWQCDHCKICIRRHADKLH